MRAQTSPAIEVGPDDEYPLDLVTMTDPGKGDGVHCRVFGGEGLPVSLPTDAMPWAFGRQALATLSGIEKAAFNVPGGDSADQLRATVVGGPQSSLSEFVLD